MKELNNIPSQRLKKAKGFLEAYTLIFNEWDMWHRRGFNHENILLLMEPQNFLFIHTVELYLKAFLIFTGEKPENLMKHDLGELREKCASFDDFFKKQDIKYIDDYAGGTKNYVGQNIQKGDHQVLCEI